MQDTRRELLKFVALAGACSVTGGLCAAVPPLQEPPAVDLERLRRLLLEPVPWVDYFEWDDPDSGALWRRDDRWK